MFTYYDIDDAPVESKPFMEKAKAAVGMVPNLHRVLAEAPVTYESYLSVYGLFTSKATLSPVEQQVVMMTSNFQNNCHYCVPAHSFAMKRAKMPDEVIEALREGTDIPDAKLQALHVFTKEVMDKKGHVGDERLNAFLAAGYERRHALEVISGLAAKLISNFSNALANVEVDDVLKPMAWTHPSQR